MRPLFRPAYFVLNSVLKFIRSGIEDIGSLRLGMRFFTLPLMPMAPFPQDRHECQAEARFFGVPGEEARNRSLRTGGTFLCPQTGFTHVLAIPTNRPCPIWTGAFSGSTFWLKRERLNARRLDGREQGERFRGIGGRATGCVDIRTSGRKSDRAYGFRGHRVVIV